ncbi:MAG: mechanosensitive ion channel [Flavobacteriales bacterium]|nr:mechanosensitive ion channel [Flavobacteriales bacterium]
MKIKLIDLLLDKGLTQVWAEIMSIITILIGSIIFCFLLAWIIKSLLNNLFHRLARNTKTQFDDLLIQNRVPVLLSYLLPLFLLRRVVGSLSVEGDFLTTQGIHFLQALEVLIGILLIRAVLNAIKQLLKRVNSLKDKPLDSYFQVILLIVWFLGGIAILSVITGKSIGAYLTTLGALSAVILLIFKDTLLGFVASIQISVNDTVRIGDWISMPNQNADGDVVGISLSTVQVRNFDNTITSIPTYKLISDSFVNWRGMAESEGRRIKRQLLIQSSSVRFLTNKDLDKLNKIERVSDFIHTKNIEIDTENKTQKVDKSLLINGRNLTNIGLFRNYIQSYLEQHPALNQKLTVMCRQLNPSAQGIPLEIYAFSADKNWGNYEQIAANLMDHFLAAAPYFELQFFEWQAPKH